MPNTLPPAGTPEQADRYLNTLTDLINLDRLTVTKTDLSQTSSSSLQEHFRIVMEDYIVEISHSQNPQTHTPTYVMLFTNAGLIRQGQATEAILAYTHISEPQYDHFKEIADDQLEREQKKEEERRFRAAMQPVDQALEKLLSQQFAAPIQPEEETPVSDQAPTTDVAPILDNESPLKLAELTPPIDSTSLKDDVSPTATPAF